MNDCLQAIPEMRILRKNSSVELARMSCQLNHDPAGPPPSLSPIDLLREIEQLPRPTTAYSVMDYPRRSVHGTGTEPQEHRASYYEDQSRSSYYEDEPRYNSRRSVQAQASGSQRNMSPQYEEHSYPASRSEIQIPIHPGPPNRNSYSSSSSNEISDRRASLASGSTATTYSGPTDKPGRSKGNSPESRTLPPIRTSESRNLTREQTRMLAQGVRAAYDSVERGWVEFENGRSSMLHQQPGHEQGRETRYEQGREARYEQGREVRYEQGRETRYEQGREARYEQGREARYEQGREARYEQGREARYEQERAARYEQGREPYYGQGREPRYEPGREPHSEHVHETGEYTRESRAILQPVSRQPASRQSVSKQNVNRQHADQQPENRQSVNFAKPEKPKRRRGNLPKVVTDLLRQWFSEHIAHPYPTEDEKQRLMRDTGLNMSQVS